MTIPSMGTIWPLDATRRDAACCTLLAAAALIVAMAAPFLAGRVPLGDDLGAFHVPVRVYYAEQLARGEPFDWMPQLFCGFYLTGEGQLGGYHPLHHLLYRWLPLPSALAVEWLASYVFMAAGVTLWLHRRLGRLEAALFGALVFTWGGFNLTRFVHPNAVAVLAHLPWLLWTTEIVLVESSCSRVRLAQTGLALLFGSQLLLGYPQFVWYSLQVEIAYVVFLLWRRRHRPREGCATRTDCSQCAGCATSGWSRVVVALCVGAAIGAVQLLPTADLLAQSSRRAADPAFSLWGSLHPLNLLQLVAPYLFAHRVAGSNTHELACYAGAVPVMLVAWLVGQWSNLGRWRATAWAAVGLGVWALLMALGTYGPLGRWQTCLPLVGAFRFPCRYTALIQLAVAVLAAMSFALLAERCARAGRRNTAHSSAAPRDPAEPHSATAQSAEAGLTPLGIMMGVSAAVAVSGLATLGSPLVSDAWHVLLGLALMAVAALLVALAARGFAPALAALVLMTAADLGCYGLSYSVWPRAEPIETLIEHAPKPSGAPTSRVVAAPIAAGGQARPSGPVRAVGDDPAAAMGEVAGADPETRTGNEIVLAGWSRADGYAGLEPARSLRLDSLPALRVAGVGWFRHTGAARPAVAGTSLEGAFWARVPDPLPYVRLVDRVQASRAVDRDLARIDILGAALGEFDWCGVPGEPGIVEVVYRSPGRVAARTSCPQPQVLVIAESYHPGWQATVDRRPGTVLRLNGDFLGCPVPAGEHEVRFEFRPASLRLGRWLTLSGLALAVGVLWGGPGRWTPGRSKPRTRT